jgi:hypothetical protein
MKRQSFRRVSETRGYRPVFIIATEGKKTEPAYFKMEMFRSRERPVRVEVLGNRRNSSPQAVLGRMRRHLSSYQKKEGDEAWLVVDRDQWSVQDLKVLHDWSQSDPYKNLAVSNPQFEYWLLLHFEDGNGINGKNECLRRLKKQIPNYSKSNIQINKYTVPRVKSAIKRAKSQDSPPCKKWPVGTGTTVYRMVEKILK